MDSVDKSAFYIQYAYSNSAGCVDTATWKIRVGILYIVFSQKILIWLSIYSLLYIDIYYIIYIPVFREKPHDDEWLELRIQKVPLLLNYSQCKLLMNEFYPVIEHCSEVLEIDPGKIKLNYKIVLLNDD